VILGAEVPAASPILVAHAPVADVERFRQSVGGTAARERAVALEVAVFDPVAHFARAAAADIAGNVRAGAQVPAEGEKFMRAERIGLDRFAPMNVDGARTVGGRADAVLPVVVIGEASPGPAQNRRMKALERVEHVRATAGDVGD